MEVYAAHGTATIQHVKTVMCLDHVVPMSLAYRRAFFTGMSVSFLPLSTDPLRSCFVPSSAYGVLGQKCFTSETHFALIFSSESGCTTEKESRKMSVCG